MKEKGSFLDMGFIAWIRKFGDDEDKYSLRGSGLPTQRDRESTTRAYKKYTKFLEGKTVSEIRKIMNTNNGLQAKNIRESHACLETNPLENPECFSTIKYCKKCNVKFKISLTRDNTLHGNCGYFEIENRAEMYLCPKCHEKYLKKQLGLKQKGLLTDTEVGELAENTTKHPYGWEYQLGFIDGYIEMRDGEKNILSELNK